MLDWAAGTLGRAMARASRIRRTRKRRATQAPIRSARSSGASACEDTAVLPAAARARRSGCSSSSRSSSAFGFVLLRRRLGLERDQRRPPEHLRPEQRQLGRLADRRQAGSDRANAAERRRLPELARPTYRSDNQDDAIAALASATSRRGRRTPRTSTRSTGSRAVYDGRAQAARPTATAPMRRRQPARRELAWARRELAARPGADLGPVLAGRADPKLNERYTERPDDRLRSSVDGRLPAGRRSASRRTPSDQLQLAQRGDQARRHQTRDRRLPARSSSSRRTAPKAAPGDAQQIRLRPGRRSLSCRRPLGQPQGWMGRR